MEDATAAQAAINALDGKDFEGRIIVVNVARPREDRPQNGGGFGGGFQRR
jgi:RNA recognition motif-containing protein